MSPPTSEVWTYFTKKDKYVATCKRCFKLIKYCGNTSNLHKHIKSHNITLDAKKNISKRMQKESEVSVSKHISDLKKNVCLKENRNTLALNTHFSDPVPSTSTNEFHDNHERQSESESETEPRHTLKAAFEKMYSHKEGGLKHNNITMCILYFICKDMQPFNVIEGEGFLKLMKEVAPFYKVPTSKYIKKKLAEKYEVTTVLYKNRIEKASDVCLTLDIWTETMAEKSFLGVTLHFFEGIQTVNCVIATKELCQNHTADYIAERITDILNEWNIPISKIRCMITDNGANMVAAVKAVVSDKNHLPCFPHTINLVVEAGLKGQSIKTIITKVRAIVKWVKNSVVNSDKLRKIQIRSGNPAGSVKKFILDVSTRWNSVYYMLHRFLEMTKICYELLFDDYASPEMPSGEEIEILKQLTSLLKPFEFVTKESSAENYITLSKVIPMVNCLKTELQKFSSSFEIITDVQNTLKLEINKRFGNIEYNAHAAIATLLDPRFKNIHFQDPSACGKAIQKLRDLMKQDMSNSNSNGESEGEESPTKNDYDFWQYHKELVIGQKRKKSTHVNSDQLSVYLSSPISSLKSNPLEEWEDMKIMFPSLYKQARMFLVVVASSVPCERLFSKAGATITQTRNRLSSKHLEKLLFLGNIPKEQFFY